jgi:hypothetical protein
MKRLPRLMTATGAVTDANNCIGGAGIKARKFGEHCFRFAGATAGPKIE